MNPKTLEDYCRFGNTPETEENTFRIIFEVIEKLNEEKLTKLNYNVILTLIGTLAKDQTDTPEKELEVCFG